MRHLYALAIACGSEPSGPVGAFEVDAAAGDIQVRHASGLALSILGFAFREADATYEMQYGSFLIQERAASEWGSARARGADLDDGVLRADLEGATGERIGRLEVAPAGESLRITAIATGGDTRARVDLGCDPIEEGGFLGFGAQTHDVDHRGQIVPVFVSEQGIGKVDTDEPHDVWFLVGTRHQSYLAVPTMVAPRAGASYGLHATTFHRSIWDLCATDPSVLSIEAWEGRIEVLISPGPRPLDVIRQQTEHTGRIPKPPPWTFGVWMESTGGTDALRAEAELLRREHIPASAIWFEDWRGGRGEGDQYVLEEDWGWDQALYPDLLIGELHDRGLRAMTYFNTFLVEGADVYDEALRDGHFVVDRRGDPFLFEEADGRSSGLADLFRPQTRDWVRGHLERALDLGIDGWMADFAEWYPADRKTVAVSGGEDAGAAHHRYPLAWAEVNREAIERSGRDDVVVFHRSGYTGSQGKAHVVWAGDQRTSFDEDDGLPTVVPIMIGLSVAGFPVVTHDIGGYVSATNPNTTKELFFRWTSLGALTPVMRTHHGRDAFLNWRWSSDEETKRHFERWADLHTALFPYWYGLAEEASESGAPIVRPLAFADPGDVRLHGVDDAFTIGDGMLVAPILTSSAAVRSVPLPAGDWYEVLGSTVHHGDVEVALPLGEIGLFARAGAVIPLLDREVESLEVTNEVPDLEDALGSRRIWSFLGGSGTARDGLGGTYRLESPSRPVGEVTVVEGEVVERQIDRVTVRGSRVILQDRDGSTHRITVEGLDGVDLRHVVRW